MTQQFCNRNIPKQAGDLVSIIVPVYNVEAYLPRCLESIATQTYRNLEIILVDDGSTDGSGRICDDFCAQEPRAKVVHQTNQGPGTARNTGLQMATGAYLAFVDGDDYLHRQAISVLHEAIVQDDSFDLAIGQYVRCNVGGGKNDCTNMQESGSTPATTILGADELMEHLLKDHDILLWTVWGMLFKKEFVGCNRFKTYPICEDREFNLRMFPSVNKAIFVQAVLYFYVLRPGSATRQTRDLRQRLVYSSMLYASIYREHWEKAVEQQKSYSPLILRKLFGQAVLARGRAFGSDCYATIYKDTKTLLQATRKAYWLNWRINPIEKVGVTLLLCSPRLTQWLLKKTKNL